MDSDIAILRSRVGILERHTQDLTGRLLGVAACVAASQSIRFDPEAAIALLPRLADRQSLAEIPPDIRERAEQAIRLMAHHRGT